MFRKMRRSKQALSEDEIRSILISEPRGVLSVLGDDDYPYGLPISYWYDEGNGHIYFHGAKTGHKIDAMEKHDKVSFCVYDEGFRREGEWALNIKSVIVFGRLRKVDDDCEKKRICMNLGQKFHDDPEGWAEETERLLNAVQCLELIPEHISGKLVNES